MAASPVAGAAVIRPSVDSVEWRRPRRASQTPRVAGRVATRCSAAGGRDTTTPAYEEPRLVASSGPYSQLAAAAVNTLFGFPPFFNLMARQAREMMVKRGEKIGVFWDAEIQELKAHNWDAELARATSSTVQYPDYFLKPFHAYKEGNLCWDAAWEMEVAAKSVHAPVFDPAGKELDPQGDANLRRAYHVKLVDVLDGWRPESVVDVGCATGLSTMSLAETFPEAHIQGVDLSPYFISVANYGKAKITQIQGGREPRVEYRHAAGEATGLPDASVDLCSVCLVMHELPQSATRAILNEARRILRPGGRLAIMEMNPASQFFRRIASNPVILPIFKSTEPWLDEYISLPLNDAIVEAGFSAPVVAATTPRHKTVVAQKR